MSFIVPFKQHLMTAIGLRCTLIEGVTVHILKVLVVVVNVVHVLLVALGLVLQVLQEGSVVADHHTPGSPGLTSIDNTHSCILLLLAACK